ncbi:hypothetical protein COV61_05245 [Candidatus Micrarchaeota archaeon CG11_big_fil_rev_8_21_14_0_20_47_5]|nr:MAG: hypothetical protein AUJ17_02360 [Candidatus Micrarchaeota archaeon CG1_02_47_40]PIN82701.1 MAG: hypothetical protein COV61_05245 [Candidatus Micrarchaeota archaeon CG11_big_fil_rev_8_21_14_0_20_47_5]
MLDAIISETKNFLKSDFHRFLVLFLIAVGGLVYVTGEYETITVKDAVLTLDFFYAPTCPHCTVQKPYNIQLMQKYPGVQFTYHDITKPQEGEYFFKTLQRLNISQAGTPTTVVGDCYVVGFGSPETTGVEIEKCIQKGLGEISNGAGGVVHESTEASLADEEFVAPFIGKIKVREYSLPMLAVVLGLIDGFNPCAMWVLVYLIALVMDLNDRRKVWLIVGTFVIASGILYFLFMTAWLNLFLVIGYLRLVTVAVGVIAIGGGALGIKEFIETKGNVICKVGDADEKKKTAGLVQQIVSSPLNIATLTAIIILAFVVNSVEFVCSSAIPAVFTQVLALSNLSFLEYYGYILLYDFFFMLDDLIIFGLAAFAITKSGVGEKYAGYCKVIGGALLLLIGLMLLFAPHMLV